MVNAHVISMTGFAAGRGEGYGHSWSWEIRSVNGKGFDLRLRLPDWVEGLEVAVRAAVSACVARGSVTLGLKLVRDSGGEGVRLNPDGVSAALAALGAAEAAARGAGFALRPMTAAELLSVRGVLDQGAQSEPGPELLAALLGDLPDLLARFSQMRTAEGAAMAAVISAHLDQISSLTQQAAAAAQARKPQMAATLRDNLARVLAGAPEADPARVAQELALLTIKADVTEELDRLNAHISAARTLLQAGGAIGKKFDFLMQEFMREANTLCSKSGNVDLTRIGLDLKTVIDQMREQVQNVE